MKRQKHEIDFVKIQKLWNDPNRIEIPARTEDEKRYLLIGKVENVHWSVVVTYRENKIRIISARRSRSNEVRIYESSQL
jgi:hypothetical protein